MTEREPVYVVFDSGFGGMSIVRAVRDRGIGGRLIYVADHEGFPYGKRSDSDVVARVLAVVGAVKRNFDPEVVVIACNTASTLALPALRKRWTKPFVGTVPAIKPAAAATRSGLVSVLATPGTVARDYTRDLIGKFALDADVTLAGAPQLAAYAEAIWLGQEIGRDVLAEEIRGAFVERDGRRTDVVALACTHYPLIIDELQAAAPWEVEWLDPADAVARRLAAVAPQLNGDDETPGLFVSTEPPVMSAALERRMIDLNIDPEPIKLAVLPDRRGVA